jgi:putative phage-type endonuclease
MKTIEAKTPEQRTDEWYANRRGKFTGSQISNLLGIKGLGATGETYAFEKAIERLYGKLDEDFTSYDMQRGLDLEPLAFAKFKELKEPEFIDVDHCTFFEYGDNAGATPDGLTSDNGILEIKCPKPSTFFKLVATNQIDKKYFAQMQLEMMATGADKAYFFNYMVHEGREYWHEIVVERDEELINKIDQRINEAVIIRDQFIEQLKANQQF